MVRSGIKYATDFILYRHGPTYDHAEWSVVVQATGEGIVGGQWSAGGRQLSWRNLSALQRLSEQVVKGLLLCEVVTDGANEKSSALCYEEMSRWSIHLVAYQRWVPSSSRE